MKDTKSCLMTWGECKERESKFYTPLHWCRRENGHGGRHECEFCGVSKIPKPDDPMWGE